MTKAQLRRRKRPSQPSQIMARVDRIALLLAELDSLVALSAEVSAMLTHALSNICKSEENGGRAQLSASGTSRTTFARHSRQRPKERASGRRVQSVPTVPMLVL